MNKEYKKIFARNSHRYFFNARNISIHTKVMLFKTLEEIESTEKKERIHRRSKRPHILSISKKSGKRTKYFCVRDAAHYTKLKEDDITLCCMGRVNSVGSKEFYYIQ